MEWKQGKAKHLKQTLFLCWLFIFKWILTPDIDAFFDFNYLEEQDPKSKFAFFFLGLVLCVFKQVGVFWQIMFLL